MLDTYRVYEVDKDTYDKIKIGQDYKDGYVVEGFCYDMDGTCDKDDEDYCLVIRRY